MLTLEWFDIDNPIYQIERLRRRRSGSVTRILAYSCLGLLYFGVVVACFGETHLRHSRATPAAFLVPTPDHLAWALYLTVIPHMFCFLWTTVVASAWLGDRRDRQVIAQVLLTPFPRERILLWVLTAHLRSILHLLGLGLPAYLVGGVYLGDIGTFSSGRDIDPFAVLTGAGIGLMLWLISVLSFAFCAATGLWAWGRARNVGGAAALGLGIVIGAAWAASLGYGCVVLILLVLLQPALVKATVDDLDRDESCL